MDENRLLTHYCSISCLFRNEHFCITESLHFLKRLEMLRSLHPIAEGFHLDGKYICSVLPTERKMDYLDSIRKWELGNSWANIQTSHSTMVYRSFPRKKFKVSVFSNTISPKAILWKSGGSDCLVQKSTGSFFQRSKCIFRVHQMSPAGFSGAFCGPISKWEVI